MERTKLKLVLADNDKINFYVQGTDQLIGTLEIDQIRFHEVCLFFNFPSQVAIIRQNAKIKSISRKEP